MVLYLNKLESPSPKDALWQVWLKLSKWLWRRRFFNFVNVFSLLSNYLPLEKGGTLHLNKLQSPPLKDTLCQVWLKLAQCFWRRWWKCEMFTDRQTDRQTDDGQKVIRKANLNFQLRWAKKSIARWWNGEREHHFNVIVLLHHRHRDIALSYLCLIVITP